MMSFANSHHLVFNHYVDYPAHPSSVSYSERPSSDGTTLFEEQSRRHQYNSHSMDPHPHTSFYTGHGYFPQVDLASQQRDFQDYQGWPEYHLSAHYEYTRRSEHHRPASRYPSGLSSLPSPKFDGSSVFAQDHHSVNAALQVTSSASAYLSGSSQRPSLAGSLDPATGIFYRTPEHPRLRTAQACEKCRTRKAKCSGEHPSCKRCLTRGLICQYAKEGRVRGPNKPKLKPASESPATAESSPTSLKFPSAQTAAQDQTEKSLSRGYSDSPTGSFLTTHGTGLNVIALPSSTTPPISPMSAVSMHSLPSPVTPIALDLRLDYHRRCHSLPTTEGQLSDNRLPHLELQSVSGTPPCHLSDNAIPRSEYSRRSHPSPGLQVMIPIDLSSGPELPYSPHDAQYRGFQSHMCEMTSSPVRSPAFNYTGSPIPRESGGPSRNFSRLGSNVGGTDGVEVRQQLHYEELSQHEASATEGLYLGFFGA